MNTDNALRALQDAGHSLWTTGLALLALGLWMHRKDVRALARRLRPKSLRFNLTALLVDALFVVAPVSAGVAMLAAYVRGNGWTLVAPEALDDLPVAAVAFASIFLGDFVGYWRHRLEHSRALWPAHVMHHSDSEMTWMTIYRFHPINRATTAIIDLGVLSLLGFPPWAIAMNNAFRHYYGIFVHMNVPWMLGPAALIFVSPAMHRWHHVRAGAGVSCNFATVFSVFDRVFRTRYVPGPCNVPLGVEGAEESYVAQLVDPIRSFMRLGAGR